MYSGGPDFSHNGPDYSSHGAFGHMFHDDGFHHGPMRQQDPNPAEPAFFQQEMAALLAERARLEERALMAERALQEERMARVMAQAGPPDFVVSLRGEGWRKIVIVREREVQRENR